MVANYKGDKGFTDLISEDGVSKTDIRIEAIGAVDEAWAAVGLARSLVADPNHKVIFLHIQNDLYLLMSQLAGSMTAPAGGNLLSDSNVEWLEKVITDIQSSVIMPQTFIVSGDTIAGGALAVARAVVRRAERRVVAVVNQHENIDPGLIKYLNRLSEVCFMLEIAQKA